ncbi:MAG: hypothetical protein ACI4QX_08810 [Lachnospiraceae bacterium]
MRIEQETRNIYAGGGQAAERMTPADAARNLQKGRIFAGNLNMPADKIAERRKEAQEKAMKIVGDAFAGELALDDSIAEMEENVAGTQKEMVAAKAELNKVQERKAELTARTDLTEEEYQKEMLELKEAEKHFTGQIMDGKKMEEGTIAAISSIKIERLKSSPMVEATESAEAVMEAAGKEIVGMLMEEAKEHIDKETEKKQEAAEEKAAKEEELEERIEAMKAEKEEKEENAAPETDYTAAVTRRMVKIAETGETVQKELQGIVNQLKLDLEDLKGAAVDEGV